MKQTIRLTETDLRKLVMEAINELGIDTLERAEDKAFDDYDSMWPDDPNYDQNFADKRFRQYNAFKDRIHQLKSEGGKKVYYIVIPGVSGFYNGEVHKVYMTTEEAAQYGKEHDGNIYTSFVDASKHADYLDESITRAIRKLLR